MLRKDVKLGFAIGGVMLAVLVVYVLVVPGTDRKPAQFVVDDNQSKTTDKPGDNGVAPVDLKSVDSKPVEVKPIDMKAADVKSADAKAGGDKPVDTAKADSLKPEAPATPPTAGPVASENASSGPDIWGSALNEGKLPPTMMSTTPVQENKAKSSLPARTADRTAEKPAAVDNAAADNAAADKPSVDTANAQKPASDQLASDKPAVDPSTPDKSQADSSTPVAADARTHVIQQGETLTSIAAAVYSDGRQWKRIAAANPNVNPNRLKLGATLVIPAVSAAPSDSAVAASAKSGPAASVDPQTQYQVQPNDSLYRISMKLYGKADRVDKIYEANKETIGADRARLKLHMILKLTEPPTASLTNTASR